MGEGVYIEEALKDVLRETDLVNFERKLCVELQLSRLEHFDHVNDDELKAYTGLSQPAIRRLRVAIAEKKKKIRKSRGIFSSIAKRESREVTKVLVPATIAEEQFWTLPENGGTSLITKEEIKLMERLGEGSFAVVKRAVWTSKTRRKLDVAAKILRDSTPEIIEDLQREVTNMQKLKHPNLIEFYGIVFSNPAMMVVEFCDGGALIDRLRSTEKPVVLVSTLIDYAQQIAKGMAYLESKNCVHRDLAARNILLTSRERVAKICDFGLMRILESNERLYVMSTQKKVPFAWCPPESLRYRQFSHASDVWSFGVTLWELFSYGEEPWVGLRGAEVLKKLEAGERLLKPRRCSDELYDFISKCWSFETNLRPKFSVLKGVLFEIMFAIAECCEASVPSRDLDLELIINDLVIVIHRGGLIWYGQNVRTRKFGSFYRSSVRVRNERNGVRSDEHVINSMQQQNGMDTYISKPIRGSFIHAGHGDIDAEQSWGHPDYIDNIYLKNPILRKEEPTISAQKQHGPEIIPSLVDLKPPSWTVNQFTKNGNDSYIDPFAPFSVYSFDGVNDNELCQPGDGLTKISSLKSNVYDEPPLVTCSQDIMQQSSVANISSQPTTSNLNVSGNISHDTSITGRNDRFYLQPALGVKTAVDSQLFSSLPQPVLLTSNTSSWSQMHRSSFSGADIATQPSLQSLTTVLSSASHLPSTSLQRFQFSSNAQSNRDSSKFNGDVQGTQNYQTSYIKNEFQSMVNRNHIRNVEILPPRPEPPSFRQVAQNCAHWNSNSVVTNMVSCASALDDVNLHKNSLDFMHQGISASGVSSNQDSLDPFEISKSVKDIASKAGYSQLFQDLSTFTKAVSSSLLNTNNENEVPKQSTVFLNSERSLNDSFLSPLLPGSSKSLHDIQTCYYWQPGPAGQSVSQQPALSSTYGSIPALYNDSHSIGFNLNKPVTNGISLPSRHAVSSSIANFSKQKSSYLSDEILGMFDPLVAERITPASNNAAPLVPNSDRVSAVLTKAAFADRQRCARKLHLFNNNVEKAVNELKIEELLSMGVAKDRGQAISALEDCRWDLNAAAAALIS